jgi:hypothetical protein
MITQKDLLLEGFWSNFASGVWTGAKEISKVVAPEITEPVTNIVNWGRETDKKMKAAMFPIRELVKFLNDYGFHPLPKGSIKQLPTKSLDGDTLFSAVVSRLKIGDNGKAEAEPGSREMGGIFKNPKVIVKMTRDKKFEMVRDPRQEVGEYRPEFDNNNNTA